MRDIILYFVKMKMNGGVIMKPLIGIHHVTAMTSSAEKIYDFFTYVLGLRLVKKTINQDDIQAYHLFFADDRGSAGTDVTFFDFPGNQKASKGTNEIAKTGLRVKDDASILYWKRRFEKLNIKHDEITLLFDRKTIFFEDFDGQEYFLISDENIDGVKPGIPWLNGPIPNEYAIIGLGPIYFRVNDQLRMDEVLTKYLTFDLLLNDKNLFLYQTGEGGNGASVILEKTNQLSQGYQGYGAVHHVAFRVNDTEDIHQWINHLNKIGARHSGFVDRFYFRSLYTRLYPNILFEFATEGPGFIDDEESYENLGELLALPPKFRDKRNQIEKLVRHIDTVRSDKEFKKEYMDHDK